MKGKSLDDFDGLFNTTAISQRRVNAALKSLGNRWLYVNDFLRQAKIPNCEWSRHEPRLQGHLVRVRGRGKGRSYRKVIAGTVEFAAQLRKKVSNGR